jgi:branched-subunit amino acid transport protein
MTYALLDVWIIILALGAGTFALRFSFLGLLGGRDLPEWALRHLRYTAVAIMPGMITPMILFPTATGGELDAVRLGATAATIAISLLTRNAVWTILGGITALMALHYGLPLLS